MKKLQILEAIGLLVGTVVGAGFLSIPYVVAKVGLPLGLMMILGIGSLMLVQFLIIAEMVLRTRDQHQIAGYVSKYLGRKWRILIYALVVLESYGALLAYIVAEGKVLSAVFGGSEFFFSLGYFVLVAGIVYVGLRLVEKVDLILVCLVAVVVIVIGLLGWSHLRFDSVLISRPEDLLPAYGVILFSFLGAGAIPQMMRALSLNGQQRELPKAVVFGALIPMTIYTIFTVVVLGITGLATTEVATIGLGRSLGPAVMIIGNLLAAITMTTSFLGLSLALKETFIWDLKKSRLEAWLLTVIVPFILFIYGLQNFIGILMFVGAVFGGLQGIIMIAASMRAERLGDREPEFKVPAKKFFAAILVLMFLSGIIYTFISR
ncbi:MAG: aromatic amino acid transport family protein [Patescibacteria group bacterium]